MLKRIEIPPGINRESTPYASSGSWYDSNNMRFVGSKAESVGGWTQDETYTLEGLGRAAYSLRDYRGNLYKFVATDWKYYAIVGTSAVDITPVRAVQGSLSNPFTGDGTSVVNVNDTAHGAAVNDFVVFSGISGTQLNIAESVWNRETGFQIGSIVDSDNYTINVGANATAATSGGSGITATYKIASGSSAYASGSGFGVGAFGGDDYLPTEYDLVDNPLTTIGTTTTVDIEIDGTEPDPAMAVNDQIYITGLTGTVDGVVTSDLNDHWWTITSVSDLGSDKVRISISPWASTSGSVSGGGTAGKYFRYDESAGTVDGATRGWGDASDTATLTGEIRRCYIEKYGEDIIFGNAGGPLYYWDSSANASSGVPSTSSPGVVMSDASTFSGTESTPTVMDSFTISRKDGHCVAFGCNDLGLTTPNSMLVRWSDQNNPFDWLPSQGNTAGGYQIGSGSKIQGAVSTNDEIVIFTDSSLYSMRFIGPPDVFGFNLITEGVEIVTTRAAINAANSVFFMGSDGFYVYSGRVEPLQCPVQSYVFDDFNYDQRAKAFASVNSVFSEVMWFYCSENSFEPDRYVCFNYKDRVWSIGSYDMSSTSESGSSVNSYGRTSWHDATVYDKPFSTYITNYDNTTTPVTQQCSVAIHESGQTAFDKCLDSYIESGEVDISDGDRMSMYTRMIPDIQLFNASDSGTDPVVTVSLKGRDFPGNPNVQLTSTDVKFDRASSTDDSSLQYTTDPAATWTADNGNYMSVRGRGRSVSMRLSSDASGFQWRAGSMRLDVQPDGRR